MRFLLYLDILGFGDKVKCGDFEWVELVFKTIDSLNVHSHSAFGSIVFSDTLLVYSKASNFDQHWYDYHRMYSIEFVQDLSFRLSKFNIWFRAFLDYGEFAIEERANFQSFWGRSIVHCHEQEKKTPCIGLFVSDEANKSDQVFKALPYSTGWHFVYFYQNILEFERLSFQDGDSFSYWLEEDSLFFLFNDFRVMRNANRNAHNLNLSPEIRNKFLSFLSQWERKCPQTMRLLKENNYSLARIYSGKANWCKLYQMFLTSE